MARHDNEARNTGKEFSEGIKERSGCDSCKFTRAVGRNGICCSYLAELL